MPEHEYRVTWEVNAEAESPQQAVEEAFKTLKLQLTDPEAFNPVFTVWQQQGKGGPRVTIYRAPARVFEVDETGTAKELE